MPDYALMRYTVPMPNNSPILGRNAEEMALNGSVLSTVKNGGPVEDSNASVIWLHLGIRSHNTYHALGPSRVMKNG